MFHAPTNSYARGTSRTAASMKLDDALLQRELLYAGPFPHSVEKSHPEPFEFGSFKWPIALASVGHGTPWAGWYPVQIKPAIKPKPDAHGVSQGAHRFNQGRLAEAREEIKKQRYGTLVHGLRALSPRGDSRAAMSSRMVPCAKRRAPGSP